MLLLSLFFLSLMFFPGCNKSQEEIVRDKNYDALLKLADKKESSIIVLTRASIDEKGFHVPDVEKYKVGPYYYFSITDIDGNDYLYSFYIEGWYESGNDKFSAVLGVDKNFDWETLTGKSNVLFYFDEVSKEGFNDLSDESQPDQLTWEIK